MSVLVRALIGMVCLMCVGCPRVGLERWVGEKGYTYIDNYSSANVIGWEVQNGRLVNNDRCQATSIQSPIPNEELEEKRTTTLEGSVEAEKLLKEITKLGVKGDYKRVRTADLKVTGGSIARMETLFLRRVPANGETLNIVDEALAIGALEMTLRDESKVNISGEFTFKAADVAAGVHFEKNGVLKVSGTDVFVGYKASKYSAVVANESANCGNGKTLLLPNLGVAVYVKETRKTPDGDFEALVRIAPIVSQSKFQGKVAGSGSEAPMSYGTEELEAVYEVEKAGEAADWDKAHRATQNDTLLISGPTNVILSFGVYVEVPVSSQRHIFLQAVGVNQDGVDAIATRVSLVAAR